MKNLYIIILTMLFSSSALCCYGFTNKDSIFNVKQKPYNAVGDGVTDDTFKIQCAIDDAVNNGGGQIFLPIGTYAHTGLTLYGSAIQFVGAAETGALIHGSKLLYTGIGGTQLFIGGVASKQIHVKNLTFLTQFNQPSGDIILAQGTDTFSVTKLIFEDLEMFGAVNQPLYGSAFNGIQLDGINGVTMDKVRIDGLTGSYAIKLAGTLHRSDVFRLSNVLYNSLVAGGSNSTDGLVIEDNVNTVYTSSFHMLQANRGFVIGSNDPNKPDPDYIFLNEITAENTRREGILSIDHANYMEITNCYVHVSGIHGINILENSGPTHISGCTIQRNGTHPELGGDSAAGLWLAGTKGGSVIGNFFADNQLAGIYITPSADGFVVNGNNSFNTFFDGLGNGTQNFGIIVNNGSKNNVITSNVLKKNITNIAVGAVTNTIIDNNVEVN